MLTPNPHQPHPHQQATQVTTAPYWLPQPTRGILRASPMPEPSPRRSSRARAPSVRPCQQLALLPPRTPAPRRSSSKLSSPRRLVSIDTGHCVHRHDPEPRTCPVGLWPRPLAGTGGVALAPHRTRPLHVPGQPRLSTRPACGMPWSIICPPSPPSTPVAHHSHPAGRPHNESAARHCCCVVLASNGSCEILFRWPSGYTVCECGRLSQTSLAFYKKIG